jgi:hypothetical protein
LDQRDLFVVFPNDFYVITDLNFLLGVAHEIAHHTHLARVRQFNQDDEIGSLVLQRPMHRMPHSFKGVHFPSPRTLMPSEFAGAAVMADPLRAELKGSTRLTALD